MFTITHVIMGKYNVPRLSDILINWYGGRSGRRTKASVRISDLSGERERGRYPPTEHRRNLRVSYRNSAKNKHTC